MKSPWEKEHKGKPLRLCDMSINDRCKVIDDLARKTVTESILHEWNQIADFDGTPEDFSYYIHASIHAKMTATLKMLEMTGALSPKIALSMLLIPSLIEEAIKRDLKRFKITPGEEDRNGH